MSLAKLAVASCLAVIALSACGNTAIHPAASTGSSRLVSRGRVDDPRTSEDNHFQCMQSDHLPVQEVGQTGLQIGAPPAGATVVFTPTAGAAQADQIRGQAQGAEVIGSALLYPHQAPDGELGQIASCLSVGVSG